MSERMPEIRVGVVGRVSGGTYDSWYVFVYAETPPSDGYSVYSSPDAAFAHMPPARECHCKWLPNEERLADYIRQNFPTIIWDDQIAPPRFSAEQPHEIRFGIVGRVQGGMHDSWYIFIRPRGEPDDPETSHTVYLCTDTTFCLAPEIRGYSDYWLPDYDSLVHDLQRHYPAIVWDEQIEPPQLRPDPRLARLAERFVEHMAQKRRESEANQPTEPNETDEQGRS
ncbi:MAG: hypothetical protein RML95_01360 [Anaerolineae bacterium]|nr:hypothetical protein [Anaerolineae bacterium]